MEMDPKVPSLPWLVMFAAYLLGWIGDDRVVWGLWFLGCLMFSGTVALSQQLDRIFNRVTKIEDKLFWLERELKERQWR